MNGVQKQGLELISSSSESENDNISDERLDDSSDDELHGTDSKISENSLIATSSAADLVAEQLVQVLSYRPMTCQ